MSEVVVESDMSEVATESESAVVGGVGGAVGGMLGRATTMSMPDAGLGTNAMSAILTPGDSMSSEKFRGLVMSAISGLAANGLNYLGVKHMGLSIQISSAIFLQLIGNVLGYVLDILFAKSQFRVRNYRGSGAPYDGPIPYNDFSTRLKWLFKSFVSKQFYRFVVTVIIDTLVSLAILNWTIKAFDAKKVLVDFKYRNLMLAALVAVGTFFLYVNVLRFDWAYADQDLPIFNIVVLMWVTLVLMMYAVTYKPSADTALDNKYTAIIDSSKSTGDPIQQPTQPTPTPVAAVSTPYSTSYVKPEARPPSPVIDPPAGPKPFDDLYDD